MPISNTGWVPQPKQWFVCKTDTQVHVEGCIDVYVLLGGSDYYCHGFLMVHSNLPTKEEVETLFKDALKKSAAPTKLTFPKGDPAEEVFRSVCGELRIPFETQLAKDIEPHAAEFKTEFGKNFFSPSGAAASAYWDETISEDDRESLKYFIPDSYDPCHCASGKKYKFCCKKIFRETTEAMCAAEERNEKEAIEWMTKAEKIAGQTGEVLCRWAIIYSYFDKKKCDEYLARCLKEFPNHPRANYVAGIEFKDQKKYDEAITAYLNAIKNYPESDRYHLNEAWNNLANVYYEKKLFQEAKNAWEKAVVLLPSDRPSKENLFQFIYANPDVPEDVRAMSSFMEKFLTKEMERTSL